MRSSPRVTRTRSQPDSTWPPTRSDSVLSGSAGGLPGAADPAAAASAALAFSATAASRASTWRLATDSADGV